MATDQETRLPTAEEMKPRGEQVEKVITPEEEVVQLETSLKETETQLDSLIQSVESTRSKLHEVRAKLELPDVSEEPPSILSSKEQMVGLQSRKQELFERRQQISIEVAKRDPLFKEIKSQVSREHTGPDSKDWLSAEHQDFMLGRSGEKDSTADRIAFERFTKQHSQYASDVMERERSTVYDSLRDDPVAARMLDESLALANRRFSGQLDKDADTSRRAQFQAQFVGEHDALTKLVNEYPEKAEAYAQRWQKFVGDHPELAQTQGWQYDEWLKKNPEVKPPEDGVRKIAGIIEKRNVDMVLREKEKGEAERAQLEREKVAAEKERKEAEMLANLKMKVEEPVKVEQSADQQEPVFTQSTTWTGNTNEFLYKPVNASATVETENVSTEATVSELQPETEVGSSAEHGGTATGTEVLEKVEKMDKTEIYRQYIAYQDAEIPEWKKKEGLLWTETYPPASKYAEVLSDLFVNKKEKEAVESLAAEMLKQCNLILNRLAIRKSPYSKSKSWAFWDIAKQIYFVKNPKEADKKYTIADPLKSPEKQKEIVDRHVGWDAYIAYAENQNFLDRIHDKGLQGKIATLLRKAPKSNGNLSSKDLAELGALIRKGVHVA